MSKKQKIAVETKIKDYSLTGKMTFDGFILTPEQIEQIAEWFKADEVVRVTLELIQGRLPGTD